MFRPLMPSVMLLVALWWFPSALGEEAADPHAAARALLVARCVECHGPDVQESGLRLDSRGAVLRGGDFGPVAVPGAAGEGELLDRLRSTDDDERMPPSGPWHSTQRATSRARTAA